MDNQSISADFGRKHAEQTKRLVESKRRELEKLMADVDEKKRKAAKPLVQNAAFMYVKLNQLMNELMGSSPVIPYDNGGGQSGLREHPGFSAYNKLFGSFSKCVKQLIDLLPSGSAAGDELLSYLEETRQR